MKTIILCMLIAIFCYSCEVIVALGVKQEFLCNYNGWIVIEKPKSYKHYPITIYNGTETKTIFTYELFYKKYNLGDTIKKCQ